MLSTIGLKTMNKPNTRARSEELRRAARALLIEQAIDVNTQVDIPPLAKLLVERERCHYTTAKLKIAQAIRLASGDISRERGWGGPRPKPIEERKARNGKIRIDISIEAAAQLQQLMLRQVDGVRTPAEMLEYLINEEIRRCSDT